MKAVICGAGIAGWAAANRLTAIGWEVLLVERAPGPREQGYMIDFFGPGHEAAELMGLLPRLQELGHQVEHFGYHDDTGRPRGGLSYRQFARAADGRIVSIMRPDIERALRESVADRVTVRYGVSVTAVERHAQGVTVGFDDGTSADADLLIGADGIHSTVRRLVFGPESEYFRYLGMHTAAWVFRDPEVYRQVANGFHLTETIDRQLGFYGVGADRVAVFAVHRSPDPARPADPAARLREVYGDLGWITPRALELLPDSDRIYYDQVAQTEVPQWNRGRVTLLGDAGYAVSLVAGQGASLAIAGAYVLGRRLASSPDVGTALAGYQRAWRPVATERQEIGRRGLKWFLPHTPGQLRARRWALRAMRLPFLDRILAAGLIGKVHTDVRSLGEN